MEKARPGGGAPDLRKWEYIGVGCLTSVIGFFGGGMIAVLVAKVAGAVQGCPPDPETGAPCHWHLYWMAGALLGLLAVPLVAIRKLRRSRADAPPVQIKRG
jgi:hypothetical protein